MIQLYSSGDGGGGAVGCSHTHLAHPWLVSEHGIHQRCPPPVVHIVHSTLGHLRGTIAAIFMCPHVHMHADIT